MSAVCVLPLAVLIALLSTGVMSRGMLSLLGSVAWAQLGVWTDGGSFLYPTNNEDVIVGASSEANADHLLKVSGSAVFNEQGADADCRIEGDTDANLMYTDAGGDNVGIGTSSPGCKLHVLAGGSPPVLSATTAFVVQRSASADDDCTVSLISDNTGYAALTFGYADPPADTEIASLQADMGTEELKIYSGTTKFDSGQKVKRTAVSGTYTVLTTDYYLGITASSAVTLNLPAAATAGTGRQYLLVVESGASTVNVDPNGSENINGSSTPVDIAGAFGVHTLVCNGSAWFVN